ncbi:MAG: hypothetical protein ACSHWU_04400 [Marinicella sp.]
MPIGLFNKQLSTAENPAIKPSSESKEDAYQTNNDIPKSTTYAQQYTNNSLSEVYAEINPPLFSDDPYIELLSLKMFLGKCQEPDRFPELFAIYGDIFKSQLELTEQIKVDCQKHAMRYPLVMSAMKSTDWLKAIQPKSDFGQLMKNRKLYEEHEERPMINQHILQTSLSTNNSAMILYANKITQFDSIDLSQQATLISSQDNQYIKQVNHIAINILACQYQNGMACQNTSGMMLSICARFPNACGMDYVTWYDENTLSGMKKDINLLLDFYQELHQ